MVADAGAIELTKNPAALISALRKIAGADDLGQPNLTARAMMISGRADGFLATHPTIVSRIDAIRRYGGVAESVAASGPRVAKPNELVRGRGISGLAIPFTARPVTVQRAEPEGLVERWIVSGRITQLVGGVLVPVRIYVVVCLVSVAVFKASMLMRGTL